MLDDEYELEFHYHLLIHHHMTNFQLVFVSVFIGCIRTSLTRYRSTLGKSSIDRPSLATCQKKRRKPVRQERLTRIKSNVPSPKINH